MVKAPDSNCSNLLITARQGLVLLRGQNLTPSWTLSLQGLHRFAACSSVCLPFWSAFPCVKIPQNNRLICGAMQEKRIPCFPLLLIHHWSLCSHLQPAYSWVFHWWSDVRLPSTDTGWSWDEKGKTLGLKSIKTYIRYIYCVQPYARPCEK